MEEIIGQIETVPPQSQTFQDLGTPKGDFVIIGDTLQDVIILQNENKMKAALSKNVRISLPKAFQTNKDQPKSLAVEGVPTDITDDEFKRVP